MTPKSEDLLIRAHEDPRWEQYRTLGAKHRSWKLRLLWEAWAILAPTRK